MIDLKDLYWAAGILEGEGCFCIRQPATYGKVRRVSVIVKMTDKDVLEHLQEIFKIGNITGPEINPGRKPVWTWQASGQSDVISIMMTLYPLMHNRRQEKIRECLEVWKADPYRKGICRKGHYKNGLPRCAKCDRAKNIRKAKMNAVRFLKRNELV